MLQFCAFPSQLNILQTNQSPVHVQLRPKSLTLASTILSQLCSYCANFMRSCIFSLASSLFHVHSIYKRIRAKCSTNHRTLIHRQKDSLNLMQSKALMEGTWIWKWSFLPHRSSEPPWGANLKEEICRVLWMSRASRSRSVRHRGGIENPAHSQWGWSQTPGLQSEQREAGWDPALPLSWANYLKSLNLISKEGIRTTSKGYFRGLNEKYSLVKEG